MTTQKDIILELTRLTTVIAPEVKEVGDQHGPAFERVLWPAGAPAVITWATIWRRHLERARESTDELVRRDVEIATERGQPCRAAPRSARRRPRGWRTPRRC